MTIEQALRLIAGAFGAYVDSRFLWFTAFVGANLLVSGFINWCPMMTFLRRAGMKH